MVALSRHAADLDMPEDGLTPRERKLLKAARGMLAACQKEQAVADDAALHEQELCEKLRTILQSLPKKKPKIADYARVVELLHEEIGKALAIYEAR